MRDEIFRIINDHIYITQSGYMNSQADMEGKMDAIDELAALMCYREVRSFIVSYSEIGSIRVSDEEALEMCRKYIDSYYPIEIANQAIEKVKNDLK